MIYYDLLMMKYKKVIIAIVLAIGIFGTYKYFSNKKANTPTYQTATAEKGTLINTISASGTVQNGNNFTMTTTASGIVKKVYVKNGDTVKKGQKIAEITLDTESNQKYLAAYASYIGAKNSLDSAKTTLYTLDSAMWSAHQIFRNDAQERNLTFDDPTYIQQNDNWKAAEAKVIAQQQVIKQSEISMQSSALTYQLASPVIYAPDNGVISSLNLAEGMVVSAGTIGSVNTKAGEMIAKVNLTEIDVTKVKTGQKVTVTMDSFADKTFAGEVKAVDTSGSASSGVTSYPVVIAFKTDLTNIYAGMAVSAKIITEVKNDVVLVNNGAITTTNGESIVKIMNNNKVSEVTVETGSSNETQTEIISGISEGDVVVTGSTTSNTSVKSSGTSVFGGQNMMRMR